MGFRLVSDGENEAIFFDREQILKTKNHWTEERLKAAEPAEAALPPEEPSPKNEDAFKGGVSKADVGKEPYKAGGKIYFTMGGKDMYGSAEFCAAQNLILTAAHCLRDMNTGEWAENIEFHPASGGRLSIGTVAIKTMWYDEKDYRWDYGFGVVPPKEQGKFALGYETNVSGGSVTAFGYPGNYYGGEDMATVDGDIEIYKKGILKMSGNPMKSGCSGGAWVKKGANTAISLNSFHYIGQDQDEYGPLFDEKFENLAEYAKSL